MRKHTAIVYACANRSVMEFDDSLFLSLSGDEEVSDAGPGDERGERARREERKKTAEPVYVPKNCPLEVHTRAHAQLCVRFRRYHSGSVELIWTVRRKRFT